MNLLFVGVFTPHSTNVAQARGFLKAGHGVYEYDYRDRASKLGSTNLRDDDLINTVRELKPDFVIFSKANHMHYRVVDECNKYSNFSV